MKEEIGKSVYRLNKVGFGWDINVNTTYKIIEIKDENTSNDWCRHFILKGISGKKEEAREVECIFTPDFTRKDEVCMIDKYLDDNGVWAEVYQQRSTPNFICVDISWGDWRHSHLWCTTLMGYLGYKEMGVEVTEEDGSDCYSAIHYFYKSL